MGIVKDKALIDCFGVQFDLPYLLRLVDSLSPEGLPEGYKDYSFMCLGAFPVRMRFAKVARDNGGARVWTEDTRGLLCHSQAQVWYDKKFFSKFPIVTSYSERWDEMSGVALALINRFAEVYRELTGAWWIRPIKQSEIMHSTMFILYKDGTKDESKCGNLGTGLGAGKLLSEDIDKELRRRLSSDYRPQPITNFAFSVTDFLDKEDFWSAALTAGVFFEAAFSSLVRSMKRNAGVPEAEVDAWFKRSDGRPRSITSMVKSFAKEVSGTDPEKTSSALHAYYSAWCSDVRDLRNDLAHGSRMELGKDEAHASVEAVNQLLQEFGKLGNVSEYSNIFLGPPSFE